MRRWGFAGPLMGIVLLSGCLSPEGRHATSWLDHFRGSTHPEGPDVVFLDVAWIERPLADPFINGDVWVGIDEQVLPVESKSHLGENGWRVGLIPGIVPPELQELLTSDVVGTERRRIWLRDGNPTSLPLGELQPSCRFLWHPDPGSKGESHDLIDARWSLAVTPRLTENGQIALQFHPEIHHGEHRFWRPPSEGGDGLSLAGQQALLRFDAIQAEVSLASNDFVVIGTRCGDPGSVGYQALVGMRGENLVQRLLVIRAGRIAPRGEPFLTQEEPMPVAVSNAPLASQAIYSSARGASPQR